MNKEYKNLVFTDHALERLRLRNISQSSVHAVVSSPNKTYPARDNNTKFIKTINDRRHFVIAQRLDQEQKWLIVSVWIRGEEDRQPLVWLLITLPFRLMWKLIKYLVVGRKSRKSSRRGKK